jgi:NAD(P)H-hydrate epimerase
MHDRASIPQTLTRDEVRAFDAWAIRELGLAGAVLMENAGRTCAELVLRRLAGSPGAKVCLFCGAGNNGGDGFVIARHLANGGLSPRVVLCGNPDKIEGDAKTNLEVLRRMGQAIEVLNPAEPSVEARVRDLARGSSLVVDALFGTGLRGEVSAACVRLIEAVNALGLETVAVDIPSGLDCDTGRPLGAAIRASHTVTFVAMKQGFMSAEAKPYIGEVTVASIGITPVFAGRK